MNTKKAKIIIQHAVEFTKQRWLQYDESWKYIDDIFIYRGYEQQGFNAFKMSSVLEEFGIFSIDALGDLLLTYPEQKKYDKEFAGSLTSRFYSDLQKGICGRNGQFFVAAVQKFHDEKIGNPGRFFWKLLYHMIQSCAFLKQNYSSSFGKYILTKYSTFRNRPLISEKDFLKISVSEWENFINAVKPWNELTGIGPNVFDFLFGDITEAQFAVNSYKFDSSNQYFLNVTGISRLITPFDRETTTSFLTDLDLPFSLREINKGIYTYCSKTESVNYGFCRDSKKCSECEVNTICAKELPLSNNILNKEAVSYESNKRNLVSKTHTKKHFTSSSRFVDAATFEDLAEIIRLRSEKYPTNYIDLLFLENKNKKLSEIFALWNKYPGKNRDFATISRLKSHIRSREIDNGWVFDYSRDNTDDPIIRLTGQKDTP